MSLRRLACPLLLSLPLAAPAASQTPADFKGETVTVQIGYGPGGGYDTYGCVQAHRYGRFIPDNQDIA